MSTETKRGPQVESCSETDFLQAIERFLSRKDVTWMANIHQPLDLILIAVGNGDETVPFMGKRVDTNRFISWMLEDGEGPLSTNHLNNELDRILREGTRQQVDRYYKTLEKRTNLLHFLALAKLMKAKMFRTAGQGELED